MLAADCFDADPLALLNLAALPARCKLMLVDGKTFAPLCEAYQK